MLGLYETLRKYEQLLTKDLINVDVEARASYYLSHLQTVAILAEWENRPKALFNYISKLRSSRGDTRMAYAASRLESIEESFTCLIRRAVYDRVAHEIVSLVAATHINDRGQYPYIPEILQRCIEAIAAGYFPCPTNEFKRKKFLRNIKIVELLVFLIGYGIPPTRNPGTAPGQYGIDIVGKLMRLSAEAIATIWKERDKYYSGIIDDWREKRRIYSSAGMVRYRKRLASLGDGSLENFSGRSLKDPLSTYVLPWARSPY